MSNLSKEEARDLLAYYSIHKIPIHPNLARRLYVLAEWELPSNLLPLPPLSPDEIKKLREIEEKLFFGCDKHEDNV